MFFFSSKKVFNALTDNVDGEAALGPVPGEIRDREMDPGRAQLELHRVGDDGNAHQGRLEPRVV